MSGPVDVVGILRRTAAGLHSVAGDCKTDLGTPMRQAAEDVDQAATAVAELIEQMRDVLALWDSNGMSIDGNAATMQCRPEKWRTALANIGSAP